jgi:hypothetical protein
MQSESTGTRPGQALPVDGLPSKADWKPLSVRIAALFSTGGVLLALALAALVAIGALRSPERIGGALEDALVRLLESINLRVVFGLAATLVAATAWSRALAAKNQLGADQRVGITRHWGGLGSGEGGWELDPAVAQWFVRVLGSLALSGVAVALLLPALETGGAKGGRGGESVPPAASGGAPAEEEAPSERADEPKPSLDPSTTDADDSASEPAPEDAPPPEDEPADNESSTPPAEGPADGAP